MGHSAALVPQDVAWVASLIGTLSESLGEDVVGGLMRARMREPGVHE